MVMCWALDCKHYSQRKSCRFFKFPKDPNERNQWKILVRRKGEPGPGAYLCSCHFRDGKKDNGPEIFAYNATIPFTNLEKRKRREDEVVLQEQSEGLPAERQLEGSFEPDAMSQPIKLEMKIEDDFNCSTGTSAFSDLPVPSQPGASVDPQPSCSKKSSAVYPTSSVLAEAENYFLKKKIEDLERELKHKVQFSFNDIKDNDKLILLYTGLPDVRIFLGLYHLIENIEIGYYLKWKVEKISRIDQLLMCLMKLRQNFPHADIAQRFQTSEATVSNVVLTWIHVLHEILFKQLLCSIPSRNEDETCAPTCFSIFTNCGTISDCNETSTATSKSSMKRVKATYKDYNTWKALIGVAPDGVVTFVSNIYPGSTSDKEIVEESGVLNVLKEGDLILADQGVLLKDVLPPGVHINVPNFPTTSQVTPAQAQQRECVARARIYVERAIHKVKSYKILKFLPFSLIPHANAILQVVGALTNLQIQIIEEGDDE